VFGNVQNLRTLLQKKRLILGQVAPNKVVVDTTDYNRRDSLVTGNNPAYFVFSPPRSITTTSFLAHIRISNRVEEEREAGWLPGAVITTQARAS
jgi:hypothetical protein